MRKKRKEIVLDFWDDINFLRPWPIMGGIVTRGAWKIMIFTSRVGAGSQTHSIIAQPDVLSLSLRIKLVSNLL